MKIFRKNGAIMLERGKNTTLFVKKSKKFCKNVGKITFFIGSSVFFQKSEIL